MSFLKFRKRFRTKYLCLADLHVLSHYGLSIPEFRGEEGRIIKANKGQLRLFKYWSHLCETVKKKEWKPDEIWIVGDIFGGTNPREKGRYVTGTLDEQLHVAVQLLKMFPKEPIMKIWSGSRYHASIDIKLHKLLCGILKEFGFQAIFRGMWSIEQLGKTKKAFVTHHASTAVVYPHTPMLRDSRWFKVQYANGKLPKIHLIIRAHKHTLDFVDDRSIKILQLPGWQILTPWSPIVKRFPMWQPDLGAVFLMLDPEDRLTYQEWLYPPFLMDENGTLIKSAFRKADYVMEWK